MSSEIDAAPAVPIGGRTRVVALLGDPVEHSLSPLIHNTAFKEQALDFVYVPLRVRKTDVPAAIGGLRALRIAGANVTIPLKQAVIAHLDELSPQARAVGAVNTITAEESATANRVVLRGDNTDVAGFLAPLLSVADQLEGCRCVVLGSGGAARAVTYALLSTFRPDRLTLAARTVEHAERLASDMAVFDERDALEVRAFNAAGDALRSSVLVVNTTPVGMHPNIGETPWSDDDDFGGGHIVYDLVYNPEETRLLKEAAARGARTLGGLRMLVGQAAASFALWTGQPMPTDAVYQALAASSV